MSGYGSSFELGPNAESKIATSGLSLFATAAQSVKTILGAGILTLSWAFYYSTMWPGILLSIFMCLLSAYTFYSLGVCSEITGKKVFGEIWKSAYGERFCWIPNLVVFMLTFLSLVAYLTIIGDYLPLFIHELGITAEFLTFGAPMIHRRVMILAVWSMLLPLHFAKDLSFLGVLSIIGTLGTLYTCALLVAKTAESFDDQADWESFRIGPGIFLTIPSLAFAFNGHFNAPEIYQRLENRSSARWMTVTAIAFGLVLVVTFICGISGYLMFGSELTQEGRSNVLNAPQFQGRPEVTLAYLATCISVSLGIPLYARSACDALELLWLYLSGSTDGLGSNRNRSKCVMWVVLVSHMCTAMVISDLGLINAIAGSVCASMNMFVLPSLMYLKIRGSLPFRSKLFHWTSIFVGVSLAITGVTTSVLEKLKLT